MDLDSSISSQIFNDQMVSPFILKHFEISSEARFISVLGSLLLTSLKTQQVKKHSTDFFSEVFCSFVGVGLFSSGFVVVCCSLLLFYFFLVLQSSC